jgi:hypothetical protein
MIFSAEYELHVETRKSRQETFDDKSANAIVFVPEFSRLRRLKSLRITASSCQNSGIWMRSEYTECQVLSSAVRIGSPLPLTRKRVLPPPLWFACGEGARGANSNEGKDTLVL